MHSLISSQSRILIRTITYPRLIAKYLQRKRTPSLSKRTTKRNRPIKCARKDCKSLASRSNIAARSYFSGFVDRLCSNAYLNAPYPQGRAQSPPKKARISMRRWCRGRADAEYCEMLLPTRRMMNRSLIYFYH